MPTCDFHCQFTSRTRAELYVHYRQAHRHNLSVNVHVPYTEPENWSVLDDARFYVLPDGTDCRDGTQIMSAAEAQALYVRTWTGADNNVA